MKKIVGLYFSIVVLFALAPNAGAVSIYFEELADDSGIVIHAVNQDGVLFESGVITGGVARAGNRDGSTLFGSDLSITRAGLGNQAQGTAIVMYDPDGVTISDLLVQVGIPGFIVWQFTSDATLFPDLSTLTIVNSVIEDGTQQLLHTYTNDQGNLVSLYARSNVGVPDTGSTFALLGLATTAVVGARRRFRLLRGA